MIQFLRFAAMRAAMAMVTLLTVSFIVFSLMELVPANCAERYLAYKTTQGEQITIADIRAEEQRLGLDRPFPERWARWVGRVFLHGDFGESCILRVRVNQLVGDKFLLSLGLSAAALVFAYAIAIPVGIFSATAASPVLNNVLRLISYLGLALPNFLLALMIMVVSTMLFGDSLTGLFSREFRDAPWSWDKAMDLLSRAWLPVFILGWSATAFAMQTVRALVSDENGKLYVTAARARGVHGARLLWRYPARHAMGPIINSLGFDLNRVFNQLPIVAVILVLTDAGALLLEALARSNDQQLAGAIIFMLTASIVALNFITDIALAMADPRVRKSVMEG
jgi:peptide/nickel transport system permease protein